MAVTSSTGTATPVIGGEVTVTTIGGGPFDVVSAFAQGGAPSGGSGGLLYRLYSTIGGLSTLIAESLALGGGLPCILQWVVPGSAAGSSQYVQAGGTGYRIAVVAVPLAGQTVLQAVAARAPVTVTLAGDNLADAAAPATASSSLVVLPGTEGFTAPAAGFAQLADISVDQRGLPQTTVVSLYASSGGGSVEAVVAQVKLPGPDDITAVLRKIALPVASSYRVGVLNNSNAVITVPVGVATYSVVAVAGAGALAPLAGNVGVSGPEAANLITPTAPLQGEALVTQAGAATWQSAVQNNPYWAQATWFVDPSNVMGSSSDGNDGLTPATAVLSYNGGIATKWGTYSPRLTQNTTITWLSNQVGTGDPVILTPIMEATLTQGGSPVGSILTIQGVLGAAQQVGAGALLGVIPKNRAAGQLLTANLGVAFPSGTLIQNTNPGKASFAWTYLNVGGTTLSLSQPLGPVTPPADFATVTAVDTWANGDTFIAYAPVAINIIKLQPLVADVSAIPTTLSQLQVINCRIFSVNGPGSSSTFIYNDVTLTQVVLDAYYINNVTNDTRDAGSINVAALGGGASGNASNLFSLWLGGIVLTFATAAFSFDFDAIVDASFGTILRSPFTDILVTDNAMGRFYITGKAIFNGTWDFANGQLSLPRACVVWGPGNLESQGAGTRVFYSPAPGAAVATFLQTGGMHLDDQAVANTFNPITNLWAGPFAISAANLDNPAVFHGFAVNVGGACYTNQGTP